jgi:acyl carrier protein
MESIESVVLEWLKQACACKCAGVFLAPDTDVLEQGLLDSLSIIELTSFLEETFRISMPLEEFIPENFSTPQAIANMVRRWLPSPA